MSHVEDSSDLLRVNSLVVLPIISADQVERDNTDTKSFYGDLRNTIREATGIQVRADDRVIGEAARAGRFISNRDAADLGRRLSADAVLITRLTNYVERSGSQIGTDRLARVDFSMMVVRTSDAKQVWEASYHFQDQTLSENLFQVQNKLEQGKGGAGFRTARDLFLDGIRAAGQDLADRRLSRFQQG